MRPVIKQYFVNVIVYLPWSKSLFFFILISYLLASFPFVKNMEGTENELNDNNVDSLSGDDHRSNLFNLLHNGEGSSNFDENYNPEDNNVEGGEDDDGLNSNAVIDEWCAFKHEESGRIYYCNDAYKGGEAVWELPEGVKKYIDTEDGDREVWLESGRGTDEEGLSGDGFDTVGTTFGATDASGAASTLRAASVVYDGEGGSSEIIRDVAKDGVIQASRVDDKAVGLQSSAAAADSWNFFKKKDAILEPACLSHVKKVREAGVGGDGGNVDDSVIASLVESYTSLPNECGIMCSWLRDLEGDTVEHREGVKKIYEKIIRDTLFEGFSAEKADHILQMDKEEVGFLDNILGDKCWRKMLIDLQGEHKDSALLTYCLKKISKRGHHDELAGQTDYFSVFNGMLISEIKAFVTADFEVSGCFGNKMMTEFDRSLVNLVKICLSAPHVFMYSKAVVEKLLAAEGLGENAAMRLKMLLRRLHAAVTIGDVDYEGFGETGGGEERKRAAEVGLFLASNPIEKRAKRGRLGECVENIVRRKSMGMVQEFVTLETAARSLQEEGEDGLKVVRGQPGFVLIMLELIFSPKDRVSNNDMRKAAAKLLGMVDGGEEGLSELLLACGVSCEGLEGVLSFDLEGRDNDHAALADLRDEEVVWRGIVGSSIVTLGVLVWARVFSDSSDFVNSTSYPTTTTGLLSVARLGAQKWDSCHMAAFDLVVGIFRQEPVNVTENQIRGIKEQCLRCLLFLLSRGHVIPVANYVSEEVTREGGKMEESLIRYFFEGLIR